MSLYELLSDKDIDMMSDYVSEYASSAHCSMKKLLRYWNDNKVNMYKFLGNQMIIEKEYEYNQPEELLRSALEKLFNDRTSSTYRFKKEFDRFLWENRIALGDCYYKLLRMTDNENLLNTAYVDEDFEINLPNDKTMKVQSGARPMRVLSRLAKAYNCFENLNGFQVEVSQVLNQKKLRGSIVLSIHPMDFMTMSDNNSDWSSCMSWKEEGCYRRGTVEMMNSECVVVAYLRGAEDMEVPGGYTWNNKKWRELFIITPDIITGVKGYPYQNSELVKTINSWLKELAEKNLGWRYDNRSANKLYNAEGYNFSITNDNGEIVDVSYNFETNDMYNDFGTTDHYAIFGHDVEGQHYINYSGPAVCMCCGEINGWYESEGSLVCNDCDGYYTSCANCGERVPEEDTYYLDDEAYCYDCYCEFREEDSLTGDEHHTDNMISVYLVDNQEVLDATSEDYDAFDKFPRIRVSHPGGYAWSRYFNIESARSCHKKWYTFRYVFPEDLKLRAFDAFDVDAEDYLPDETE